MRATSGLLLSSLLALTVGTATARADAFLDQAKATVQAATAKSGKWDGPTSGPARMPGKSVVIVAGDLRNGGHTGVANGAAEAAAALGWTTRVIDGQGTVAGVSSAMSQAIALKPDGIINAGFDIAQNMSSVEEADKQGIRMVAWHGGPTPGPVAGTPVFFNVTTDPEKVAEVSAMYAVAQSDGKAGVVVFTDSAYAIAIKKSDAMAATIKKCADCKLLSVEDTPLADVANRMPQLTTSLLQRYGDQWTYSLGINDLYYDFMGPSLTAAGKAPEGPPMNISGGDGSESAYQRIRTGQYQVATVPEPLTMQGWQLVDELNRAFAGEQPSGYFAPVHLVVQDNIAFDGGDKNIYDPDNGYRDAYKKIWKVKERPAPGRRVLPGAASEAGAMHHQPAATEVTIDEAWPDWLKAEFAAAPGNAQVGSRLLSVSERVRVWHLSLAPGERLPVHCHVLDYFWTALTPGRARSHYHDGRTQERDYAAGDTAHYRFGPGEFMLHDLENIGEAVLAFTTVEFLDSANPPLPLPPS